MDLKYSLFLAIALFCLACNQGGNMEASLSQLEKEVASNPTPENSKSLIDQYLQLVDQNPQDAKANVDYLSKAAGIQVNNKRFNDAIELLKRALKSYPSENAAAVMSSLAAIYNNQLKNSTLAQAIYQGIATKFPDAPEVAAAQQQVKADAPALADHIEGLRNQMYNDSTHRIDQGMAREYVDASELYALINPTDAQSGDILFKAGETARSTRNFAKAISIYDWIYKQYPNYEKAPQALFLKGFTLDNDLKQVDQAKAIYEEFLKKYPNDDFADDTKFLLGNIGKSDEEIIKSFEETTGK
ncbi:MAG: tetratricopeptide repeat protein [Bacteroidota bacterium]